MSARAQSQVQSSSTPSFTPAPVNLVQRKCACGGSAGLSCECGQCQKEKLVGENAPLVQPKLKISEPNDKYEQEADRVADEVMRMPEPTVQRQVGVEEDGDEETIQTKPIASQITPLIQRQVGPEEEKKQLPLNPRSNGEITPSQASDGKPKSNKEEAKDAIKKTGEAFLNTEPGKEIVKQGKDIVSSLPGKVITGTAAIGAVSALIATNKELPIQAPAIPLNGIHPGLSMKITVEGPLRSPTKAMISFSGKFGVGNSHESKKQVKTESEKLREENNRKRREDFEFRESLKTPEEKARDNQRLLNTLTSRLPISGLKSQEEIPAPEKEKKEGIPVQRKKSSNEQDISSDTSMIQGAVKSIGQPLDISTRSFMEERFSYDFAKVRVHTNADAATSARVLNAEAYTAGRDIVFSPERYMPQTRTGRELLAHELTHVVQQDERITSKPPPRHLLSPSSTIGHMAVVQSKKTTDSLTGLEVVSAEYQKGNLVSDDAPQIQLKLKINQPNDKYVRGEYRLANEVMRMPKPKVQRQVGLEGDENKEIVHTSPIISQISPLVQREIGGEEEFQFEELTNCNTFQRQGNYKKDDQKTIQTKGVTKRNRISTIDIKTGVEFVKRNSGYPLPQNVRDFMEQRFGHGFSHVRIHTDDQSDRTAKTFQARAFTLRNHIVFRAGQFVPTTIAGKSLLAHELAHTLQQTDGYSAVQRAPAPEKSEDGEQGISIPWKGTKSKTLFPIIIALVPKTAGKANERTALANRKVKKLVLRRNGNPLSGKELRQLKVSTKKDKGDEVIIPLTEIHDIAKSLGTDPERAVTIFRQRAMLSSEGLLSPSGELSGFAGLEQGIESIESNGKKQASLESLEKELQRFEEFQKLPESDKMILLELSKIKSKNISKVAQIKELGINGRRYLALKFANKSFLGELANTAIEAFTDPIFLVQMAVIMGVMAACSVSGLSAPFLAACTGLSIALVLQFGISVFLKLAKAWEQFRIPVLIARSLDQLAKAGDAFLKTMGELGFEVLLLLITAKAQGRINQAVAGKAAQLRGRRTRRDIEELEDQLSPAKTEAGREIFSEVKNEIGLGPDAKVTNGNAKQILDTLAKKLSVDGEHGLKNMRQKRSDESVARELNNRTNKNQDVTKILREKGRNELSSVEIVEIMGRLSRARAEELQSRLDELGFDQDAIDSVQRNKLLDEVSEFLKSMDVTKDDAFINDFAQLRQKTIDLIGEGKSTKKAFDSLEGAIQNLSSILGEAHARALLRLENPNKTVLGGLKIIDSNGKTLVEIDALILERPFGSSKRKPVKIEEVTVSEQTTPRAKASEVSNKVQTLIDLAKNKINAKIVDANGKDITLTIDLSAIAKTGELPQQTRGPNTEGSQRGSFDNTFQFEPKVYKDLAKKWLFESTLPTKPTARRQLLAPPVLPGHSEEVAN